MLGEVRGLLIAYDIKTNLAIIGTKSFVNDVIHAVESFLKSCQQDQELRQLVEERLPSVLQTMPYPSNKQST